MTNKPQKGLKELRKTAQMNGIESSGDVLTIEVSKYKRAVYDTHTH